MRSTSLSTERQGWQGRPNMALSLLTLFCTMIPGNAVARETVGGVRILPPPIRSTNYIIATLESVQIKNDTDYGGPGEVMIIAGAGSGSLIHTSTFPVAHWRDAKGSSAAVTSLPGTTTIPAFPGTRFPVNIPLAVMPESQMGDNLMLTVAAVDNDETAGWLQTAIPALSGALGTYIGANVGGTTGGEIGGGTGTKLGQALSSWLGSNETIGTFETMKSRALDDWGLQGAPASVGDVQQPYPCVHFSREADGMIVDYSICRVPVPPSLAKTRLFVKLDKIITHGNGDDGGNGQVYAHVKVSDGVGAPVVRRFPASGTKSLPDEGVWTIDELIYEKKGISPFLQVEVDVWDHDTVSKNDMLGVVPWAFVFSQATGLPTTLGAVKTMPYSWKQGGLTSGPVTVFITMTLKRE